MPDAYEYNDDVLSWFFIIYLLYFTLIQSSLETGTA
jgi:hypothetical protein